MTKILRMKKRADEVAKFESKGAEALKHKGIRAFYFRAAILPQLEREQKAARRFNGTLMAVIRR
ncbi:hypothetical protein POTG_01774 [Paenibacillus sp. oral taxon 786 str. D14]|uniref:hypothetical protein n=1 Tax=Paenibacillus sp. oral taxon 786 TaxID=652715 RepID=UPI0001AFD306|nr:hypothetical protein [Paenibacillus sp. oral taxon 786]EES73480.1 hypothetical protein POTG_01774 [Paenibacillus sp. oral taxon 786 str. D14]